MEHQPIAHFSAASAAGEMTNEITRTADRVSGLLFTPTDGSLGTVPLGVFHLTIEYPPSDRRPIRIKEEGDGK